MPGLRAHGPLAERFARRLPADVQLVLADPDGLGAALRDAVERGLRGERVAAMTLVPDPALTVVRRTVHALAAGVDGDTARERFELFTAGRLTVDGAAFGAMRVYEVHALRAVHDLHEIAGLSCFGSSVERGRLRALCALHARRAVHWAPLDPAVPPPQRVRPAGPHLVVWAPDLDAAGVAPYAVALGELRMRVTLVCAAPPGPVAATDRVACVPASGGTDALASATAIMDASGIEAGAARALARWGLPLAVTAQGGAEDALENVLVYDAAQRASIVTAALEVHGGGPPADRGGALDFALPPEPAPPAATPLVTAILPTRDRPHFLAAALASARAQTYPALEIVVVHDGTGDPPPLPPDERVRLARTGGARGAAAAMNAGIAAARGEFVAFLGDDDLWLPRHVTTLVAALERSRGDYVHAQTVDRYLEGTADGGYDVLGYDVEGAVAERWVELHRNAIPGPASLIRRSVFERVGRFDESFEIGEDLEFYVRASGVADIERSRETTAVYTRRTEAPGTVSPSVSAARWSRFATALERIYARYPTADRPVLERLRGEYLRFVAGLTHDRAAPHFPQERYPLVL